MHKRLIVSVLLFLAAAADRVHSTEAVGRGDQVRAREPHSHHQRQREVFGAARAGHVPPRVR